MRKILFALVSIGAIAGGAGLHGAMLNPQMAIAQAPAQTFAQTTLGQLGEVSPAGEVLQQIGDRDQLNSRFLDLFGGDSPRNPGESGNRRSGGLRIFGGDPPGNGGSRGDGICFLSPSPTSRLTWSGESPMIIWQNNDDEYVTRFSLLENSTTEIWEYVVPETSSNGLQVVTIEPELRSGVTYMLRVETNRDSAEPVLIEVVAEEVRQAIRSDLDAVAEAIDPSDPDRAEAIAKGRILVLHEWGIQLQNELMETAAPGDEVGFPLKADIIRELFVAANSTGGSQTSELRQRLEEIVNQTCNSAP